MENRAFTLEFSPDLGCVLEYIYELSKVVENVNAKRRHVYTAKPLK